MGALKRRLDRTAAVVQRVGDDLGWSAETRLRLLCSWNDEADLHLNGVESFDYRDAVMETWLRQHAKEMRQVRFTNSGGSITILELPLRVKIENDVIIIDTEDSSFRALIKNALDSRIEEAQAFIAGFPADKQKLFTLHQQGS